MRARYNSVSKKSVRKQELYETPPEAVRALLKVEALPRMIWEPAAGKHAIVRELQAAGHYVVCTDLVDYGIHGSRPGCDFLTYPFPEGMPDCIVTNPPFSMAHGFASRGITLASKVCLLLRVSFLGAECRYAWWRESKLARVHVFSKRLPMMHRDDYEGKKSTSNVDHAWFVFDRSHVGPAIINHIVWERES